MYEEEELQLPRGFKTEIESYGAINFLTVAGEVFQNIITAPFFPFRTGNLKWNATSLLVSNNSFAIVFNPDKAFYVHFLEYGTRPHLIPNAFGRGITVLHPGSQKHVDFIQKKSVDVAINTLLYITGGKLIK
jgi:hypothetical protein